MKQHIALLAVCTSLCFTGFSQNYKADVLGTWKCVSVNDSLVQIEIQKLLHEAKTLDDSLNAGFIGVGANMLKELCSNGQTMAFISNNKIGYNSNWNGVSRKETAKYKLEGDHLDIIIGESKPRKYKVLSVDAHTLVLFSEAPFITITYTKQ